MTRTKSALIVFIVLAGALVTALSIDYTDTYVADRFHKALESGRFQPGQPFSLDAFLEYYDWDTVCVIVPGKDCLELRTLFGFPYVSKAEEGEWSLVFVKGGVVGAEVPIRREKLGPPPEVPNAPINRWAAIVDIRNTESGPRMFLWGSDLFSGFVDRVEGPFS